MFLLLLAQEAGALCHVAFLLVEWHVDSAPEAERNASRVGGGVRLSLEQRLRSRCEQPQAAAGGGGPLPVVLHEVWPPQ